MSPTPKPGILDIGPYAPGKAKTAGFDNPVKLSANENPLGCSDAARKAYLDAASEMHLYPDPNTSRLRAAIAAKFALEAERLIFGAGSDELFSMACQVYLGVGDNMVQPEHGFAAWGIAARAAGGVVKSAPERQYTVNVDAMLAAVDERTRIVFVANPANPTGTWLPFREIERLHAGLPANVLLVLDGAYAECAQDVDGFSDGLDWSRDKENVLITRTFSKLYGLASLRIGWGYAAPSIIDAFNRIRLPFSVPRAGEAAAVAALQDEAFLARSMAHAEAGRARLFEAATRLGLWPIPSATNFVTIRIPAHAPVTAEGAEQLLAEQGILVRWLGGYGLADCLRVSVGTVTEIELFVDVLAQIMGPRLEPDDEAPHVMASTRASEASSG